MNKIAADDEKKFPKRYDDDKDILSKEKKKGYETTVTAYRIIIGPLDQRFTRLVIDTIDTRSIV